MKRDGWDLMTEWERAERRSEEAERALEDAEGRAQEAADALRELRGPIAEMLRANGVLVGGLVEHNGRHYRHDGDGLLTRVGSKSSVLLKPAPDEDPIDRSLLDAPLRDGFAEDLAVAALGNAIEATVDGAIEDAAVAFPCTDPHCPDCRTPGAFPASGPPLLPDDGEPSDAEVADLVESLKLPHTA